MWRVGSSHPAIAQDDVSGRGRRRLVWFQMNKETDWRIDSSATSEAAFVTMAKDPYFNP